jgi:hypothetical protein
MIATFGTGTGSTTAQSPGPDFGAPIHNYNLRYDGPLTLHQGTSLHHDVFECP